MCKWLHVIVGKSELQQGAIILLHSTVKKKLYWNFTITKIPLLNYIAFVTQAPHNCFICIICMEADTDWMTQPFCRSYNMIPNTGSAEPPVPRPPPVCASSPAAAANGRVASPVIPVAPNITTFFTESDMVRMKRNPGSSSSPSARSAPEARNFHVKTSRLTNRRRNAPFRKRGASAFQTPPTRSVKGAALRGPAEAPVAERASCVHILWWRVSRVQRAFLYTQAAACTMSNHN